MSKLLNGIIALLLPAMAGCGTTKVQDVPEEIYACPMPTDPAWGDEPVEEPTDSVQIDTLSTK